MDKFKSNSIKALIFYGLLMGLVIFEFVNVWNSTYVPNSIHHFGILVFCLLSIHIVSVPLVNRVNYFRWILLVISLVSAVLAFRVILNWNFRFTPTIQQLGFQKENIGTFRAWFRAYGWVINEWSAVLIGLLPMITLTAIYFRKWRLYLTIVTGIVIAGILLSGSRGALLAAIIFYGVFPGLNLILLRDRRKTGIKFIQYGFASLIVVAILVLPNRASLNRLSPFSTSISIERSDLGRINAIIESKNLIRKYPWFGIGSGNYTLAANVGDADDKHSFRARVNNSILEVLIERGILGLFYFAVTVVLLLWYLADKLRKSTARSDVLHYSCILAGILAVMVREVTFSSIFHNPVLLCLFLLLVHLGLKDIFKPKEGNYIVLKKSYLVSVALLLVLGLLWMGHYWTNRELKKTILALNEKNLEKAAGYFSKVSNFSTENVNYALAQTILLEANDQKNPENLTQYPMDETTVISIDDPAVNFNLGYYHWKRGSWQNAQNFLTKAAQWPFSGMYNAALSRFYFENDQHKEAESALIRGILKQPDLIISPFMDTVRIYQPESFRKITKSLKDSLDASFDGDILRLAQKAAFAIYLDSNFVEAQLILEDVSQGLPNLSRVWHYLALCYRENEQYEEAIRAARKAAFLSPLDYLPTFLLAELHSDDWENARTLYERALYLYFNLPTTRSKYADYIYQSSANIRYESVTPSWVMETRPKIDLKKVCDSLSKIYFLEGNSINTGLLDSIRNSPSDLMFAFDPNDLKKKSLEKHRNDSLLESATNFFLSQYPEYINSSPDFNQALYKTRWPDSFELLIKNRETDAFMSLDVSDRTQLSLTWHPNNREIYFQQYDPIIKGYRLYSLNTQSRTRKQLQCPPSSTAIPPLRFSENGKYMAYLSTGAENILWLYECKEDDIVSQISRCKDREVDFQWISDSVVYFVQDSDHAILSKYSLHSQVLDTIILSADAEIKSFDIRSDIIYSVLREAGSAYFQLYSNSLTTRKKQQVTFSSPNIDGVKVLPTGEVIFQRTEKAIHRVCSLNDDLQLWLEQNTFTKIEACNTDYILTRENFNEPRSIWYLNDVHGKNPSIIKYYSTTFRNNSSLPKSEFLKNTKYENEFEIFTWNPSNDMASKRDKVILYVHGGPHIQEDVSWNPMVHFLTSKGYHFVKVNYSGSTGYTKKFESVESIEKQSTDILATLEYLQIKYKISLENIYIITSSYGSVPTFEAIQSLPEKIAGMIWISGVIPSRSKNWPESLPKKRFKAYYGEHDPLASTAYDFFQDHKIPVAPLISIFRKEGHFFHNTSSWAKICSDAVELFK